MGKSPDLAKESPDLLRIRLLGTLELRRGETVLPLPPSRRTRALLGYLVATATPQSRATLCDLLWDGPGDPRASLRWSLTKLREVVNDGLAQRLLADRERVRFQTLRCEIDTEQVRASLREGIHATPLAALEAVAGCLKGEFLDGLDLPACYRFHHWCMVERERLGELRREVLNTLVQRLAGEPGRALPYGHAMVAADPLAEASHATLVRLLAAVGRYPDAERHYDWAHELLRREIALPAGGELDAAIHHARREQRAGAAAPAPTPSAASSTQAAIHNAPATTASPLMSPLMSPITSPGTSPIAQRPEESVTGAMRPSDSMPSRPSLIGREPERTAIAQAVAGASPPRMLLFAGEPGIGKTRLLDHFAQAASVAGYRVIRARCFEAEMVRPYGLWLDALRGVPMEGIPAEILAQAMPLLARRPDEVEGGNRERLIDAVAALLRALAARQPLALLLDDLQWIDEGSVALLHFLTRTLSGAPIIFGAAARAGEVDDNSAARGLLQSLTREGRVQRMDLCPLDAAQARALLGTVVPDIDDALSLAGGNPLYLIELALSAQPRAAGGVAASGEKKTVEALIDGRLSELDQASRDLLGWAAAFGNELRPDLLAEAAGLQVPEVLARLARFERRGLIAPSGQGHFDFAHGLIRQGVYRALSQPRRRAIHRRIAHSLVTASADDPQLHGEIVHHASLAGDQPMAVRACLAAGQYCLRVFANEQAARVAERGLAQAVDLSPGAERVRLEISLLRLWVTAAAGAGGRRLPALAERIEHATLAAQSLSLHADAAAGWEILAYWRQQAGDTARTAQATLAAERMTRRTDVTTRCLQLANSGRCLLDIEADPTQGRAMLAEATRLADELDLEVMEIHWARGLVARMEGDFEGADAALAQAVALARLAGNHWREYECTVWLAIVAFERGQHREVLRRVEAIQAAATRMGEPHAPFAQALGALARLHTRDGSAQPELDASLDALRRLDDKAHLAYALNEAAALALAAGRTPEARACASEALDVARAVRRPTEVVVALARLAASTADPQRGAEWLAEAAGTDLSARASAALADAATKLPIIVPTIVPTIAG